MSDRANAKVGSLLGWICVLFFSAPLAVSQCTSADRRDTAALAGTEISRIGTAEVKSAPEWVIDSDAYRCRQPDVYWHDSNWSLDLILPSADRDSYSLRIRPAIGPEKILRLDDLYDQIASISATPNNKAIVVGFAYGSWSGLFSIASIVSLSDGTLIDQLTASSFSLSPNRRFIVYLNGDQTAYPLYDYRLYDVLRTPREDTCGFMNNDPQHKNIDEELRGIPLYPKKAGQTGCSFADQRVEGKARRPVSNYLWSADSTKLIFVDAVNQEPPAILLATMPDGPQDRPRIWIDRLRSAPIRIPDPPDPNREPLHLSWTNASDQAVSIMSPDSAPRVIQLSSFVPVP